MDNLLRKAALEGRMSTRPSGAGCPYSLHHVDHNMPHVRILRSSLLLFARGGLMLALVGVALSACGRGNSDEPGRADLAYEERDPVSPKGTGRFFMGREIAQVVGSDEVDWIERPGRETAELPDRVVRALELQPADVVADIGAGTGYFSFRLAPRVPLGKVFAVDIDPDMLSIIRERRAENGMRNVVTVRGTATDPNLPPDEVDVALIVYTYPQFSHPREMMTRLLEALRPGGRVVLVEYRGEDGTLPIDQVYRLTEQQARKELEAIGFRWRETRDVLPQQHFMVFEKPVE